MTLSQREKPLPKGLFSFKKRSARQKLLKCNFKDGVRKKEEF